MKKIGILGGAGPEAGYLLFNMIIKKLQSKGKFNDHEFPEIHLLNYPFHFAINSILNEALLKQQLADAINKLEKNDADLIAFTCNTLHAFIPKNTKLVNIIDCTIENLKKRDIKKALFLGTSYSVGFKLYQDKDIDILYPLDKEQKFIDNLINLILKNHYNYNDYNLLKEIIFSSKSLKIDTVILGCTELSVLYAKYDEKDAFITDPLDILANKLIGSLE